MSIEKDRKRLAQVDALAEFQREPSLGDMLSVYYSADDDTRLHGIYGAIIPRDAIDAVLSRGSWELLFEDGVPFAEVYLDGGKHMVDYSRYVTHSHDDGVEPLVIRRDFEDLGEVCLEVSDEFRHFHNLWYNDDLKKYYKFDESGDACHVMTVGLDYVEIRVAELRQFLAAKGMCLSLQFDVREYSEFTLNELGLSKEKDRIEMHRDGDICYGFYYWNLGSVRGDKGVSVLYGKKILHPLSVSECGFPGVGEKKEYEDFIVDADSSGNEVTSTCDPDVLGGDHVKMSMDVYFHRAVLDKYYQEPGKYEVSGGYVRRGSQWALRVSGENSDVVSAWLGDIGLYLPYWEQMHWRRHNFALAERGSK